MTAVRFLIRDRAGQFTGSFDAVFTAEGIRILAGPPQAPRANAICERIIGTLRRELLDRLLIVNEQHLRRVLTEYLTHYNTARPHRSLGQLTPAQAASRPPIAFSGPTGLRGAAAVAIDELFQPGRLAKWIGRRSPRGHPELAGQAGARLMTLAGL
jgi:Integrase core domain